MDVLKYKSVGDFLVRSLGVGIFVIENYNHLMYFDSEVSKLVAPAIRPLPRSLANILHAITITLGLTGSLSVREELLPILSYSHSSSLYPGSFQTLAACRECR